MLNYIWNSSGSLISDTNNDSFKNECIVETKRTQLELNKLKTIKKTLWKNQCKESYLKRCPNLKDS